MTDDMWTQATLGDVVKEWIVGSTPPRTNPEYFVSEGGTPWVKVEDVKSGTLYETVEQLSKAGGRRLQLIKQDAVLVTTSGTVGKVAIAGRPVFCNQAVQALLFRKDLILPQYGSYFLRSQRPLLLHLANRTTIDNVPKGRLQSVVIRFPPLQVQEKMIAQMRIPEILCERAERLQTLLKNYLLATTIRAAKRAKMYMPIGELLAEQPLTGLRAKASPTGNGVPLVNKLSRDGGRLTGLDNCLRVQVSEKQIRRYSLRQMDILLHNAFSGTGARGTLVGSLPEEALTGGNLIRLRLRPSFSSPWLLAWLRGPGGDRLYVDGKLQKHMLQQYRVPIPEGQPEFDRRFLLCLCLEEKAAQFVERAQALFESILRMVFYKSAAWAVVEERDGVNLARSLTRLTEPMNLFLQEMSQFQREMYHLILQSEDGQPVHTLFKRMRRGVESQGRAAGIQDALTAVALLEQFGLVEQEGSQKIPLSSDETNRPNADPSYVTDHNGQPVLIDTYKPTEDIFEENVYAVGTGQD